LPVSSSILFWFATLASTVSPYSRPCVVSGRGKRFGVSRELREGGFSERTERESLALWVFRSEQNTRYTLETVFCRRIRVLKPVIIRGFQSPWELLNLTKSVCFRFSVWKGPQRPRRISCNRVTIEPDTHSFGSRGTAKG
jgi:hypothetical protein